MTTSKGRIIVPGEPPERAAPLFHADLWNKAFLSYLTPLVELDKVWRVMQLRASMPRGKDGR